MHQQDANDPTGVSNVPGTPPTATPARLRKANASIQMRLAGATWAEIAQALGYPTPRAALVAVEKALEKELQSQDDRETLRSLASLRLDRLLRSVWPKAVDPANPEHLLAVTKARELVAQFSKLHGLDAPAEVIVHSPTVNQIEEWVARAVSLGLPAVEEYDVIDVDVIDDDDDPDAGVPALVG